MNEQNEGSSAPDQGTGVSPSAAGRSRHSVFRIVISLVLLLVFAVGAYSLYVAVHESDPQETVVLGQTKIASGSPAGLRVLVRNRVSGKPVQGARIELSLLRKAAGTIKLGTFHTDAAGSVADPINIPDVPPGEYQLVVDAISFVGRDHIVRKVEVQHPARILLSSDKPIYQPGQTVHLRSLIIHGRTQQPFADETVVFEVSDPKGNKVFKEHRKTSAFGIASADFVLASELNLGRYELRAVAGAATTGRTIDVKRYVLPKFKIRIATDKPYYLPGQTVSGSIEANYFFGKPVSDGTVKLTVATYEEKPVVVCEVQGRTDLAGKCSFQFVLPDFFVGMPQNNERAFLDLTAEVRDTGRHAEQAVLSLSVSRTELELAAIPEAGVLVPGVENVLYVLTAYPDGRPAVCEVFVNGTAYQSGAQGVCEIKIVPADANQTLDIQALDQSGRKAKLDYRAEDKGAVPALLLRTDRAVYQAGQTAQLTILSPAQQNTVFIDVIKDNQTVLTRSVPMDKHQAEYSLPLPASLVGVLKVNAYVITETGGDRGCSRVVYVNPASGLQVATRLSKPVYRPGEIARLDFNITDAEGRPVPAALGIAAVDESVFALSENRPGLLGQFLDVEGGLLKPRYQIKFFDSPGRLLFDTECDQGLIRAYLSSLDQGSAALSTGSLAKYLPSQETLERVRSMRGTPAYEALRSDSRYADILRVVEGEGGTYSLREATGAVKLRSVEAHRKAYFSRLSTCLQLGFLGLLFLLPVLLLIYYSRSGVGITPKALTTEQNRLYIEVASSTYNFIAVLILCPILLYPVGAYFCERWNIHNPGWVLLSLESAVVLIAILVQFLRIANAEADHLGKEMAPLRTFVRAFLMQFVLSRLGCVLIALHPHPTAELFAGIWFLASVVSPLIVLGGLGSHIRRQLAAKAIAVDVARIRVVEILVIISIVAILAGLLLPSLSSAKSKGMRVSLMNDLRQIDAASQMAQTEGTPTDAKGNPSSPRIRRDFPETLFWRPELITDDHGKGSLEIPLADSITTWRASVDAVSSVGRLGSVEVPIAVFQDFFADLDLPVSMSLGDEVSVPVTCYNYLKEPQDIRLAVAAASWFKSPAQNLSVHLGPNEVKSVSFPIKVLRVGDHTLRVTAQGAAIADAIEREVRVTPVGERIEHTRNDVLKADFADTFTIPEEVIADSQSLWIRCYPSRFSEVMEGLDAIFQAPHGCFEQTSSTTYPNVLVLDYMKRMGRLTPEIEIKARKFINAGYQRLLTFEVPGGGFEWFGNPPANICLTAYGILEFTDMARVHPVDSAVAERARGWLFARQNSDGSWNEIHRGWTWSGRGSMTAFVAWALAESGDQSPGLDKALNYLRSHPRELSSTYARALAANAFLAHDQNDSFGRDLANQLKAAAVADDKETLHWTSTGYSVTYSHDSGMETECTALCAMALMKAGTAPQSVKQAMTWISTHKFADGTQGSTQATILAMRALLQASTASWGQDLASTVTVLLNGENLETFRVNQDNSDVMRQIDLTKHLHAGENRLELRQAPPGELPIQVTGVCWLPARSGAAEAAPLQTDPLHIKLQYDRTTLAVNDRLKCAVTVENNTGRLINMAIVDLGIPPGFDMDSTGFDVMQQGGRIAKFELTGNQVILYLREISNERPFQFEYSLRAKYPLRVQTPSSAVYEYYQPKNRAETKPVVLKVLGN